MSYFVFVLQYNNEYISLRTYIICTRRFNKSYQLNNIIVILTYANKVNLH